MRRVCEASQFTPGEFIMVVEIASSTTCIQFFTAVSSSMHAKSIHGQDDNCRGKIFTLT